MDLGNLLIIGDSYSTFNGYVAEGCNSWYSKDGMGRTDVVRVEDTWWHRLISKVSCTLVRNESFSGTTVCNTERPSLPGTSFVYRTERLVSEGFFRDNRIDTVIIFGGTNDSWIDSPIGEDKYELITREDLYSVLPAYSHLIALVKANAPSARIVSLINCDIKDEIMDGMERAADHYGITAVRLKNIDKMNGHPSVAGMAEICRQVLEGME